MITIIMLAFSVIGLLGLFIGNRFILIIFSASMTLIMIASITIYAIGRTGQDSMRPKVPYYTRVPIDQLHDTLSKQLGSHHDGHGKLKSLVGKWFNKSQSQQNATRKKSKPNGGSRTGQPLRPSSRSNLNGGRTPLGILTSSTIPPIINSEELTDESTNFASQLLEPREPELDQLVSGGSFTRSAVERSNMVALDRESAFERKAEQMSLSDRVTGDKSSTELEEGTDYTQVENEQWVNYEKYLYSRYMHIVSQSIDLVLLTILSGWMALLLDEDSDHCFGTSKLERSGRTAKSRRASVAGRELHTYNYNGVRYSIRSDLNESPTRIVVQ